jgi:pSer/pThr/pTyr-binding forkhead associated (FHA) protein
VYDLDQSRIVIGRGKGSDVHIPHPAVSAHHATLRAEGARWVVTDEGSTNGTKVNGERLPSGRPKRIETGSVIDVGGFRITVEVGVPIVQATSVERTSALARQIVREVLGAELTEDRSPKLRVLNGPDEGRAMPIPEPPGRLVVGRGEECDLSLSDADLSREHAELVPDLDGVTLRDLGSKNGSLVNERRVETRRLRDGDEIRIGRTVLLFEDPTEALVREVCKAPEKPMELPEAREVTAAATVEGSATEASAEGASSEDAGARVSTEAEESRGKRSVPVRRAGLGADVLIYLLAGAVLALSALGLYILLEAG